MPVCVFISPQQVYLRLLPDCIYRPHSPPTQQARRRASASGTHTTPAITTLPLPLNAWLAPISTVLACAPLYCLSPGTEISVTFVVFFSRFFETFVFLFYGRGTSTLDVVTNVEACVVRLRNFTLSFVPLVAVVGRF
jgi:hypothetical protein